MTIQMMPGVNKTNARNQCCVTHDRRLYLIVQRLVDVAKIVGRKLKERLQLQSRHLFHHEPVICNSK